MVYRGFSLTWPASMQIKPTGKKKLYISKELTGLVWNNNMAAVSLSWNTDMTAVTSCEKALQVKKESNLYKVFKILAKHKFDTRDQSVCKRRVKVFQFSSGNHQDPYRSSVFFKLYTSQQTSPTSCSFRTESFPLWINWYSVFYLY